MADGIVALALIGGDERLELELAEIASQLTEIAVLPEASSDRADALLVADGSRGAALDRVRAELVARPGRRILLVGAPGAIEPAEAMACGARGLLELPLAAGRLRAALAAAGCLDDRAPAAVEAGVGPIVLLGAAGGCGVTTCAVALSAGLPQSLVIDLDLVTGDAAAVAGAPIEVHDALLSLAYAPGIDARELRAQLAEGPTVRVLPAPALPEQADLVDEGGVSQVLDAVRRAGLVAVVDAGSRIGIETVAALERAAAIAIVSPPGRNGRRGVARVAGLLLRLGFADRPVGVVASRVWPQRRADVRELAASSELAVWATVWESASVGRAARAGAPPPVRPYAGMVGELARLVAS